MLDKIHDRLGSWKGKLLSQASRLALIQAVTSVVPAHVMQTCKLPGRVLIAMEKANRGLLWGDTGQHRSIHPVA